MKKRNIIAIILIVLSIGIGVLGLIRNNKVQTINKERLVEAQNRIEEIKKVDKEELERIEKRYNNLEELRQKGNKYCREHDTTGASDYLKCVNKNNNKYKETTELKEKIENLKNKTYELDYKKESNTLNIVLIILAVIILIASIFIGFVFNKKCNKKNK